MDKKRKIQEAAIYETRQQLPLGRVLASMLFVSVTLTAFWIYKRNESYVTLVEDALPSVKEDFAQFVTNTNDPTAIYVTPAPTPTPTIAPSRKRFYGVCKITGYDPYCKHCCRRADGITASGKTATIGKTVAMSKDIPFGTVIEIDGLGRYTVEDRGVDAMKVDIACENHAACYKITGKYNVYIVEDE